MEEQLDTYLTRNPRSKSKGKFKMLHVGMVTKNYKIKKKPKKLTKFKVVASLAKDTEYYMEELEQLVYKRKIPKGQKPLAVAYHNHFENIFGSNKWKYSRDEIEKEVFKDKIVLNPKPF